MPLWKTEVKRTFPNWRSDINEGADDQVGEKLREYVVAHIDGYTNLEASPELKKYSRILDGRTPMSADMFIDLRILLKTFHQVKQKELAYIDKVLALPESIGYEAGFLASANKVEEVFNELFEEPEIKKVLQ
jgi:hypothetical protein|tara:strand:- start:949 stop:1344 length:396 start_codon:yes stop_codon:yes gene_type:complete